MLSAYLDVNKKKDWLGNKKRKKNMLELRAAEASKIQASIRITSPAPPIRSMNGDRQEASTNGKHRIPHKTEPDSRCPVQFKITSCIRCASPMENESRQAMIIDKCVRNNSGRQAG